jgi:hypothetical protein
MMSTHLFISSVRYLLQNLVFLEGCRRACQVVWIGPSLAGWHGSLLEGRTLSIRPQGGTPGSIARRMPRS